MPHAGDGDPPLICTFPNVSMIRMMLVEGAVEVYDFGGRVELENWTTHPSSMKLYREDAAVLRALAEMLESNGESAPADAAERLPDFDPPKQSLPDVSPGFEAWANK